MAVTELPKGNTDVSDDSILEESLILLNFPEFLSTPLFKNSSFELVADNNEGGVLYDIKNCSFKNIRLDKIVSANPSCILNENLPLNGRYVLKGLTYMLVDETELNEDSSAAQNAESQKTRGVWYTDKSIEFSTKS